MLFLRVNEEEVGSTIKIDPGKPIRLKLHAEAASAGTLDRLEVVAKGRVVKAVSLADSEGRLVADLEMTPSESGWLAARCFERPDATIRFAHTSPIYIQFGDRPSIVAEDARYFIAWIDREVEFYQKESRFRKPQDRAAMLSLFEEARQVYLDIARKEPKDGVMR